MGPITDFIVTFRRDYGKYVRIKKEVEKICKSALQDYNILWQSRVKTADSLEKKLRNRQKEYTDELENIADIKDLIGVRIILGRFSELKYVEEAVDREFEIKGRSQHLKLRLNQGHSQSRFRGYGAFHFHVTRCVSSAEQYPGLVIEIQVTSPFMWAFSQLEHDIVYKKLHGEPDESLVSHLEMLKGIANLGELAVQQFEAEGLRSLQQPNINLNQRDVLVDLASKVHQFDADDKRCLPDLRVTDPEDDMERIQSTTHQLVESCCSWVFDDSSLRNWWSHDDCSFLWIHGDPGKGKTMILVALVKEISRRLRGSPESNVLAYFFCQNSSDDLNTTVSVLRGLIFHLINQEKTLICHLRKKYDSTGKLLFEGPNAQYALQGVLFNILNDQRLGYVYLMVDALDECDHNIYELLDWIARNDSKWSSKVKWLTTSRNHPAFIERLGQDQSWHTSLELNFQHVSHAVATFIGLKVDELAQWKKYNLQLQAFLKEDLREKADGTFLWVALVCNELGKVSRANAKSLIEKIPRGLLPLYARMLQQVIVQDVEDDATQCQKILRSATVAFRPLRLSEIARFTSFPDSAQDLQDLEELIIRCGSFLFVRQDTAYFVHQSAKDYLSTEGGSKIFPSGQAHEHAQMTRSCLEFMSETLKRDVCSLKAPGIFNDEVQAGTINEYLAYHVQYSCQYWVGHLHQVNQDGIERVYSFFQSHLLHWLEAMSLTGKISDAILMIEKLNDILKSQGDKELVAFISDARRFVLEYRYIIETAPLQIYHSALLFAPKASLVKRMFSNEMPAWATILNTEESWTSCLQTLEGHVAKVSAIAFSPDGSILASAPKDSTVKLWDPATGELRATFKAHAGYVSFIAFSSDGSLLASASKIDENIKLWDPATGGSRGMFKGTAGCILAMLVSPKGSLLACTGSNKTFTLWNAITGELQSILKGHSGYIHTLVFSPDGSLLVSTANDGTIRV